MEKFLQLTIIAFLISVSSLECKIVNTMYLELIPGKHEETSWNICGFERSNGATVRSGHDLTLYVDNSSLPYVLIVGNRGINGQYMDLRTAGGLSWEESMLLESPPPSSRPKPFFAIGDLDVGEVFWFEAVKDEFILCKIAEILPKALLERKSGDIVRVSMDWVEPEKEINIDRILPDGWRFPREEDFFIDGKMTDDRKYILESIKHPLYLVGADFNGDCNVDYACVLVNNENTMHSIKVFFGLADGNYREIEYYKSEYELSSQTYISYCAPGLLESHWEKPLELLTHAFYIGHYEVSSELVYFDSNTNRLKSWQQSD